MAGRKDVIVCRAARAEDYEAVLDIDRNIYDGLDYVKHRFPYYISSSNRYPFVLEKNGEIVTFLCRHVVDDGTAIVQGAGRTRADLRGQNLGRTLDQYAVGELARLRPEAQNRRLFTGVYRPVIEYQVEKNKIKVLLTRGLKGCATNMRDIKSHLKTLGFTLLCRKYAVDQTRTPDKNELVQRMMSNPQLFPEGLFIVFWEPYRLMKSNIMRVADNNICFITSSVHDDVTRAVSFVTHFPCKAGMRFDLEFYGSDTNLLLQHFLKAMHHLCTLHYDCDVHYVLYFPLNLNKAMIESFINDQFGWLKSTWSDRSVYGVYEVVGVNANL